MKIKLTLRQRIIDAIRAGDSDKKIASEVRRSPEFVRRVYREWQKENLVAARRRREG